METQTLNKLKTYIVHVSRYMKYKVYAQNELQAKLIVWADIRDGYTYGYQSWQEFKDKVKVEEAE